MKTPAFGLVLAGVTVALAAIVLTVSIFVFIESGEPTTTESLNEGLRGNGFRGARVFVNAGCADCHTLATAGASGTRGSNLDRHFAAHRHALGFVIAQITNGGRGMPAFGKRLSPQQIRDVATFVVDVAGRSGERP
jgi:mono/diheme cytochrome c family protein